MEKNRKAPMEMREQNRPVRLGLIQCRVSENISANMDNALERTREAASRGAQIICHQELYRTRYNS